jgi:hypothetical protein
MRRTPGMAGVPTTTGPMLAEVPVGARAPASARFWSAGFGASGSHRAPDKLRVKPERTGELGVNISLCATRARDTPSGNARFRMRLAA